MFTSKPFSISTIVTFALLLIHDCSCINLKLLNSSIHGGFSGGVATWYDDPNGPGSGAACGYGGASDVANAPFYGLTAAGNNNLYQSGKGCGACYQVKCTGKSECSGSPVTITITNECPGDCNIQAYHFDLSGKAFGNLAKPGQEDTLRKYGIIDIEFQRVPCTYMGTPITFKIDEYSNPYYLAIVVEYVNGDGDLSNVKILPQNPNNWISMRQVYGATYALQLPQSTEGPYSVQLTTKESKKSLTANNVIPPDWKTGANYKSSVNF